MNRLVLSASVVERGAMRYTPAGLPALDLSLSHESEVSENGHPRRVAAQLRAVGIGEVTQALGALALGSQALFAGFLTNARNGRGLVLHVTEVEPLVQVPLNES